MPAGHDDPVARRIELFQIANGLRLAEHVHGIVEEGELLGAHGGEARVLGGRRHAVSDDLLGEAFAHRRDGADAAAQLPVLV